MTRRKYITSMVMAAAVSFVSWADATWAMTIIRGDTRESVAEFVHRPGIIQIIRGSESSEIEVFRTRQGMINIGRGATEAEQVKAAPGSQNNTTSTKNEVAPEKKSTPLPGKLVADGRKSTSGKANINIVIDVGERAQRALASSQPIELTPIPVGPNFRSRNVDNRWGGSDEILAEIQRRYVNTAVARAPTNERIQRPAQLTPIHDPPVIPKRVEIPSKPEKTAMVEQTDEQTIMKSRIERYLDVPNPMLNEKIQPWMYRVPERYMERPLNARPYWNPELQKPVNGGNGSKLEYVVPEEYRQGRGGVVKSAETAAVKETPKPTYITNQFGKFYTGYNKKGEVVTQSAYIDSNNRLRDLKTGRFVSGKKAA